MVPGIPVNGKLLSKSPNRCGLTSEYGFVALMSTTEDARQGDLPAPASIPLAVGDARGANSSYAYAV